MSHLSWPAFIAIFAVLAVIAVAVIASGPGKRGHLRRLGASILASGILGAVFVGWVAAARHAAMASAAAASGGHQTVAGILESGFIGSTLALTVILFGITTAMAGRRRPEPQPLPRRRRTDAVR